MNLRQFAREWLKQEGLFKADSEYDGLIGKWAMEVVELIASQGHSGGSAYRTLATINAIYEAYDNPEHPVWQAYWQSDEGQKLMASVSTGDEHEQSG